MMTTTMVMLMRITTIQKMKIRMAVKIIIIMIIN